MLCKPVYVYAGTCWHDETYRFEEIDQPTDGTRKAYDQRCLEIMQDPPCRISPASFVASWHFAGATAQARILLDSRTLTVINEEVAFRTGLYQRLDCGIAAAARGSTDVTTQRAAHQQTKT